MEKQVMRVKFLWAIYVILALAALTMWTRANVNLVSGDEPHYLIMASGIIKHGTFEQTLPYKEEFANKEIVTSGLLPPGASFAAQYTHAVEGPHGLYNMHNVGLPLLLALPFLLGGVLGAKLWMVLLTSLAIPLGWKMAGLFFQDRNERIWAVAVICLAMPYLSAGSQIYSDIVAGLLSLLGLYWFCTVDRRRPLIQELLLSVALSFLPWLQIKFGITAAVLLTAVAWRMAVQFRAWQRCTGILLVAAISMLLLLAYNHYAFGKMSGPYSDGAVVFNKTSLMVLMGLLVDQNQGFLLQNPIHFIGLFSLGILYRYNRSLCLLWGLVFLSLIFPNSLHPAWYGGMSFAGRFNWPAAVAFMVPTLAGLAALAESSKRLFATIMVLGISLQIYFFYLYAVLGADLYSYSKGTLFPDGIHEWSQVYSLLYVPVQAWLPMLYDSRWAYGDIINLLWLIFVGTAVLSGLLRPRRAGALYGGLVGVAVVMLLVAGLWGPGREDKVWNVDLRTLPSQTGHIDAGSLVMHQGRDAPAFSNFGPFQALSAGEYELTLRYSSPAPVEQNISTFRIMEDIAKEERQIRELTGTLGRLQSVTFRFAAGYSRNMFEFTNYWSGTADMRIEQISVRRIGG
ncbi:hypothetical protein J2S30_004219 [Herbaspirillum rubrisubalbicans]|uniref:hypothetical protein n=1 Tax=Herbaspirillum rubrisubalbicans TaxID=80842 RepID=UPI00209CD4D9|nr:hypothetical protein [Herbaspirillum rubrisubalbicans]MCP1575840.1 hypothetical protein [Herbaspirillum rubrisubalbicans]